MASSSLEKGSPQKSGLSSYLSPLTDVYDRFSRWRTGLGLSNPGTVENLTKEVKTTHLTNFIFDGARADLTKALSISPAFQVTHSFALASQTQLPSYNFAAIYANSKWFMHGTVDHEGTVNGRFNTAWSEGNITKLQMQLSQQRGANLVQIEQDYQGSDFSVNVKAVNPSPLDGTGVFLGSYLQSITKNTALGVEGVYQAGALMPGQPRQLPSFLAKYTSDDKNWIATAQFQPLGALHATYWQRISDKVEAAAELQLLSAHGKREGIATLGAKYDLRMSTFRAQVDSTGKVSAMLEQRFAPTFAFIVTGEIDHFKNAAKVGVGVMIESSSLTPEDLNAAQQFPAPPGAPY